VLRPAAMNWMHNTTTSDTRWEINQTAAALERALAPLSPTRMALPYEAGFLAAQAFLAYRRRDGPRRSPLPDFYIGAHAQI